VPPSHGHVIERSIGKIVKCWHEAPNNTAMMRCQVHLWCRLRREPGGKREVCAALSVSSMKWWAFLAGNGCRSPPSFWLDSACWALVLHRLLPHQAIYIPLTTPTPKGQLLLSVQYAYGCCLDLVPCHLLSSCLSCCGSACVSSTTMLYIQVL